MASQGLEEAQSLPTAQQEAGKAPLESVMFEMKQKSSLLQHLFGRPMSSPGKDVSRRVLYSMKRNWKRRGSRT